MLLTAVAAAGGIGKYILHVLKILILGVAPNVWDTSTDIQATLYYFDNKSVERVFQNSSFAPSHCTIHENVSHLWLCHEMDPVWGTASAIFIQLPGFVLGFCVLVGVLLEFKWTVTAFSNTYFCIAPLFALIPFPALVLTQQLISLFLITPQMELMSSIFLFGEGSLEATPQLLLGLYIMLKDRHRINAIIQYVSAVSSFFSISKTSIEMYSAESFDVDAVMNNIVDHTDTYQDSIMEKKDFCTKLLILIQLSPAFITSLVFRVGSLAIITVLLQQFAILYMAIGCIIICFAAYKKHGAYSNENIIGASIFYAISNITIVSKCPMGNRKENYGSMMSTSLVWTILHSLVLISLMIWVGLGPNYWLTGWSETAILASVPIFMGVCTGLLIMGPIAIIALRRLKKQIKGMGEKENRDLWDPSLI